MPNTMNLQAILADLRHQRNRIQEAIEVLEQITDGRTGKRWGRKTGRHMSAEARARISAAQKKRWAAQKRAAKSAQ